MDAEKLNSDGLSALAAGDAAAARRSYRRALAILPTHFAAHGNLGNLEASEGRFLSARRAYGRALTVAPHAAGLHMMLGTMLLRSGEDAAGERAILHSIRLNPGYPKAHLNLGLHKLLRRDLEIAEKHLRLALAGDPASDAALAGLGCVLSESPRSREATSAVRRAIALAPGSREALHAVGQVVFGTSGAAAANAIFRRALSVAADAATTKAIMFGLHYDPAAESSEIYRWHRRWASLQPAVGRRAHRNAIDPERRLRVGYLSADLFDHPIGRNIVGLIEEHDPAQVEAFMYSEIDHDDRVSRRLRSAAAVWRSTAGLDDRRLAELIEADGIDVLAVLGGVTIPNRLSVAALKPAPVQLSLHDFTTSGLDEMDGFVTDGILNPEDGEERFSETVLRLPCFYLHMPIEDVSLQRRAGEPFTMGSCNNPAKLNDRVIELWSQVLKVIPGSRLMLKYRDSFSDPALVEDFGRRFAAQGIDASRVILDGRRVGRGEHLAFVGQLDVALDPFPFNGSTTTYEALWMGVPVVTLAGRRFVGRVGAAMLHQVGLPDLVAGSLSEYVEIVVRLASDGPRRALLRTDLRRRLLASALMNAPAYARNVEAMYRQMWRRWCGSRSAT